MSLLEGISQETTVTLGALAGAMTLVVTVAGAILNSVRKRAGEQTKAVLDSSQRISGLSSEVRELTQTLELRLQAIEARVESAVSREDLQRVLLELQASNRELDVPVPVFDRRDGL